MEFLLFLLIAIFVIVTGKGSGQKKPAANPTAKLRDRMEALRQQAEAALEPDRLETPAPAPVPVQRPRPTVAQGVSHADDEGCVGGSMKHAHTEGETREEHRRHLAELHKREAEEQRASEMARELSEMNLQKLRRAVVMAEVLGKPAAMKKRRTYYN